MGMLQKAAKFVKRCGAPSKFAARLMVQAVSPGPHAHVHRVSYSTMLDDVA